MPIIKEPKAKQPAWKEWDYKAQKKGLHHTVYSVNGDQFTGEWDNNKKNGKGTYVWKKSGLSYDGEWKGNMRSGFGTLSSITPDGVHKRVYAGGWKFDQKHGFGTFYYEPHEYYEGEWQKDLRCGWGRMYYADGSVYEGEWLADKRSGSGMYRLANQNRYEGEWLDDLKHGKGKFYHLDKGQVFVGMWVKGIAKCGTMTDFGRDIAPNPTIYPLPELKLQDPKHVLDAACNELGENQS